MGGMGFHSYDICMHYIQGVLGTKGMHMPRTGDH